MIDQQALPEQAISAQTSRSAFLRFCYKPDLSRGWWWRCSLVKTRPPATPVLLGIARKCPDLHVFQEPGKAWRTQEEHGLLGLGMVACIVQNSCKKTRCTAPDFCRNSWLWVVPWQRPWDTQSAPSSPVAENNPVASGELNKGINVLVNAAGSPRGSTAPRRARGSVSSCFYTT